MRDGARDARGLEMRPCVIDLCLKRDGTSEARRDELRTKVSTPTRVKISKDCKVAMDLMTKAL